MAIAVVDPLEVIDIQHGQQQIATVALPAGEFEIQPFIPCRPVGQSGQRVLQGLLPLLFQMAAQPPCRLFQATDTADQLLQALAQFLLLLAALATVVVDGVQQAIQTRLHHPLEAVQIGGFTHAVLQAADLFAQLGVQRLRRIAAFHMALVGGEQVLLHRCQTLVESLQVVLEIALPLIAEGDHQHRQIVQHRHQLVPVQALLDSRAQRLQLRLMLLGQMQAVEQTAERRLHTFGDNAESGLRRIRQRIGGLLRQRLGRWRQLGVRHRLVRFGLNCRDDRLDGLLLFVRRLRQGCHYRRLGHGGGDGRLADDDRLCLDRHRWGRRRRWNRRLERGRRLAVPPPEQALQKAALLRRGQALQVENLTLQYTELAEQ